MRLLLLAGSSESVQIGQALARETRVVTTASVARARAIPRALGVPTRIGGWGGAEAFGAWLERESIDAVLDATHPFAVRISERSLHVCRELGVEYMQFLRPQWTPTEEDRWHFLNDETDAAKHIPAGAKVLLASGRRNILKFAGLAEGRTLFFRVREPGYGAFPFEKGRFILRPVPLSANAEETMMRALEIDWLVARNTGGSASATKLEAARRIGLPVAVIRRPPQPEAPRVHTVAEVMAWLRRRS